MYNATINLQFYMIDNQYVTPPTQSQKTSIYTIIHLSQQLQRLQSQAKMKLL